MQTPWASLSQITKIKFIWYQICHSLRYESLNGEQSINLKSLKVSFQRLLDIERLTSDIRANLSKLMSEQPCGVCGKPIECVRETSRLVM